MLENKWKKHICMSHSVNILISQLIISYSFWRSYLTHKVWSPFPYRDREIDMETDVLRKVRFAARYRYISIMLLKTGKNGKMTLPYKN